MLSWYNPPTIKPPPTSLDVALPLTALAHAQEPPALRLTRKGWRPTAMPARRGRREHTPAWRPLLPSWHSKRDEARGRGAMQVPWAVKAQIPEHRQRMKQQFFLLFFLASPCFSSYQSVCQAGKQALSMSEY